jgi:hypothetical protein
MKRLADLSPNQLAWCIIGGGVIAACSLPAIAPVTHAGFINRLIISLSLLAIGLTLELKALSLLKDGLANEQWPSRQIDPLRSKVESPVLMIFTVALLIGWLACFLVFPHGRIHETAYSFYLLSQSLMQLRYAFRKSPPPVDPAAWQTFKPLQSEHWGQHKNA